MTLKAWTLFCLLFIVKTIPSLGQELEVAPVTNVLRLNILNPGIGYEMRIGKQQTFLVEGGFASSFGYSYSSSLGSNYYFSLDPMLGAQYRYYYLRKRYEKGKRTALNSQNYLAAGYSAVFTDRNVYSGAIDEEENLRPYHTLGVLWGFQRNYKSRISLDCGLGLGYSFGSSTFMESDGQLYKETTGGFTPIFNLNLGIWLNRRQ